ncbi:hypothetical protein GCM10022224_093490 [Nonomuraea antimicrobica]|uniref:N-acetyltransferase domain-containing protein n=2 Tax=Nonomuraea antimicrobica TaxID=561173 RepID=A0ABP7E4A7_9ACTN
MRHYPRPKTRDEALGWIRWSQHGYHEHGHGLWLVALRSNGAFVGNCGLTLQEVDGAVHTEVGYLVRTGLQGNGYATEAAAACRDHARDILGLERLIAIIHPDNVPSQRVAAKIDLTFERETTYRDRPAQIHATTFPVPGPTPGS